MNPSATIEIITRIIFASLIFAVGNVWRDIYKYLPPTYLYYVISMVLALILFLMTFRFGKGALKRDMRELFFYDILVQSIGLALYLFHYGSRCYSVLSAAITILQFGRLLWIARSADGNALVGWPTFGLIGYFSGPQPGGTARQNRVAIIFMAASIPLAYLLHQTGIRIGMGFWSMIPLILAPLFAGQFLAFLEQQSAQHTATVTALAAAEATAVTEAAAAAKYAILNAELQQLNEERALMVADFATRNALLRDASHDLAHPLFWMQFCGQQQVQAQDHDTRLALSVQFLDAMAHFRGILNDTIHNAKITTKLEPLTIRAISANAVTIWLWDQYQPAFADIGVEFSLYKANQRILQADGTVVPDLDEERVALAFSVSTDVKTFKRILANLVMNALRHTAQGHVLIALRKRSNATCWIEVRDTGSGIPGADGPDWAANFVNLAQNVRNGTMRSQDAASHGLGINNVKNLCATLGTTMQLYSKVGWGSIFRFVLPLADADLASGTMADDIAELAGRYPDLIQ
jgi:signal transduction histidine kinase